MAELEPDEQVAFLEQCSIDDPALADSVKALLASGEAASPLDSSAAELAAPIFEHDAARDQARAEARFGPYRIIREIGRGGMGAVYMAERSDDQYQKKVALKILPPWSASDERSVQRFVEERQILAALDHPEIARLLDGGITADGLPWFAMELVDGLRIDQYCDEQRLPVEARLELFCQVAAAVQYAHRNLVVHRDLKPANILVTPEGRVKLLDFGIAKLLGGQAAELTVTSERLLTPLYASPEQIRGEQISTASDVYTLGVLLHVLLTGRYPYRLSNWEHHEVARAVLEQDPLRPSLSILRGDGPANGDPGADEVAAARRSTPPRLRRSIEGDLDAIVLKAIEKEPGRRYTTVEQLETDLRRHLAGQPVLAQPESRLYYARKFVRR
ncbi:MAG: serine/threonine-protein kinase, partial [Gemmatimonadaceae bacterium]